MVRQLAQEHGLDTPEAVLHHLLNDASNLYDRLWDETFAQSQDVLERWRMLRTKSIWQEEPKPSTRILTLTGCHNPRSSAPICSPPLSPDS